MAEAKPEFDEHKKLTSDEVEVTEELVPIYVMGQRYDVPASLTIQKALEYAGYFLIRSCGCRAGICGACSTVYRLPGSYRVEIGLACQTVVVPHMHISQIPFFPAIKAKYDIEELKPEADVLAQVYPEIYKCMGCNTCTRSCPMDIPVMEYMSAAIRGDIERCAELSFNCIMCGLCAARCPAENVQYNVGILARRLTARYLTPQARHVQEMLELVENGAFDECLDELQKAGEPELRKLYSSREVEPVEADEFWKPTDRHCLAALGATDD